MAPLTPSVAAAIAAILRTHPRRLPHWTAWADRLQKWADDNTERQEDS